MQVMNWEPLSDVRFMSDGTDEAVFTLQIYPGQSAAI